MKLRTFVCFIFVLTLLSISLTAGAQSTVSSAAAGYAAVTIDSGYVGEDYSQSVEQTLKDKYKLKLRGVSRTPDFEWVAVDPLPPGLAIDPATGQIFGTPSRSRPQPYQFRLHVVDRSVANPAALKLQLSLKIMRGPRPGPAPTLEPVDTPDAAVQHEGNGGGNGAGNGAASHQINSEDVATAGSSADVEIHAIEPKEKTTLTMTIKNPSIRQIEVLVKNKEGEQVDTAKTPANLRRGEVKTSVTVNLKEGSNTLDVKNADTGELYSTIPVTLKRTKAAQEKPQKKPQETAQETEQEDEPKIKIVHGGVVARGATSTPITIEVDDDIKAVNISVKEQKGEETPTDLPNYYPDPIELKRGENKYTVVIPVSQDPKATTIVTVSDKDQADTPPVELKITHGEPSGLPKVEVGYSGLVNKEVTSVPLQITVNDPKISRLKVIVKPVPKNKDQVAKVAYDDIFNISRGEDGILKVIGLPSDNKIDVSLYDVSESKLTENKLTEEEIKNILAEESVPPDKYMVETLRIERRSGGAPASTIDTNSLNTRAIVGFEQAGASSADSESKPFLDFFFNAPLRFKPSDDLLPRFSAWGQVRLSAVPEQVSTFGTFASNFVNPLAENKLNSLVQGFDFLAGLEARVFGTNKPYLSLIPGVKQQTFFNLVGGGGAISPLSASDNRTSAQIFKVPKDANSSQRKLFIERFSQAAADSDFIAFVFPERDRFLRQFYGGVRLKTFYYNDDGTLINRFPAIFDFMIGQNEAVTGGRLQSDVTDEKGRLIGRERRYVLRLEAFYPLPIKQASFIYLFGTALMKVGGRGVKIETPLFLDTASSDVSITDPKVFVIPTLQANRDYYRIGVGVNLTDLFNRRPTSER